MSGEPEQNPFNSGKYILGLALSGGGFRASLFHIGVLARLAELDLLKSISVLSTVSGGSIIGAAYYLMVKELLEGKRTDRLQPSRDGYIQVVEELAEKFLEGVQKNIRMLTFADPWKNARMLREDYSRSDHIAELYREHFYKPTWDRIKAKAQPQEPEISDEICLRDIKIVPSENLLRSQFPELAEKSFADRAKGFDVKIYNKSADYKVPILTINATTLNTCHNWQFTSSWVGEPPPSSDPSSPRVDYNRRLERMRFDGEEMDNKTPDPEQLDKLKTLTLGDAVAASAAVPGIFHPFAIHDLYKTSAGKEIIVQLVDGGVFDNQGISALSDARCTHIICSDASGQTEDDTFPSTKFYSVLLRSNDILMDRVRDDGLKGLFLRNTVYSHLERYWKGDARNKELLERLRIKEYIFFHLKGEFKEYSDGDERYPEFPRDFQTSNPDYYTGFYRLSNIRTDLDSFSDIEAFSLMYDGYSLCGDKVEQLQVNTPDAELAYSLSQSTRRKDWFFLRIRDEIASNPQRLLKHLKVGSEKFLKVFLLGCLKAFIRAIPFGLLLLILLILYWNLRISIDLTLGRVVTLALIAVLSGSDTVRKWLRPYEKLRRLKSAFGQKRYLVWLPLVGTFVASVLVKIHLRYFDPLFLEAGKVGTDSGESRK